MERVDPTTEPGRLLVWSSRQKAIHLPTQAGRRCSIRLDGKLQQIAAEQFCSFRGVPQHMLKLQDQELPTTIADLIKEPRAFLKPDSAR